METQRQWALEVARILRSRGYEAVFAGGCVRDALLGRPVSDFDVATSALPAEVMAIFPRCVPVGEHFGVVRVVREPGVEIETATFRSDGPYLDGRRPSSVRFSSAREDVLRRDFTVNGMLQEPETGEVLDYVGGREDLMRGIIRAIGDPDRRFAEDKLRLIRAVRFAARLGFRIEPATWRAIQRWAPRIHEVSAERIRDELCKILAGPDAGRAFHLLQNSGLLREILPEMDAMVGCEQPPEFHPEGDVFTHTCLLFDCMNEPKSLEVALGALFHDIGKPPTFTRTDRIRFHGHETAGLPMTENIMRRLRFSNAQIELTKELVADHLKFASVMNMRAATLKRFLRRESFPFHLELHRIDCMASHMDMRAYEFCLRKLDELAREPPPRPRLVTGEDLKQLGLAPGPRYREILDAVEDAQLEQPELDREQALDIARRLAASAQGIP
ncbi:MAG: CCA-adding enzyme [Myxococcota bacterium]|nr:CCA-adding enzyme [Myxococcota bacterium]